MKALIFDTETTGLIKSKLLPLARQPKVIEYFGVILNLDTFELEGEVEFLANPGHALEQIIINITGLRDEDLKDAPPFADNLPKVIEQIQQVDALVAHNVSYDISMLGFEFKRAGVPLEGIIKNKAKVCTVAGTEHIKGRRMKLSELHEHLFGSPFEGAHRAREDVMALARCYTELKKRGEI